MTAMQPGPDAGLGALFTPLTIGRTTLANRFVMSPMTRSFCPAGVAGPDVADYYRRRAQGGTGLIITEGTWVPHAGAANNPDNPDFFGEASLAGWRRVVDAVHDAGGRIMPQLWHIGLFHRTDPVTGLIQPPASHHVGPSGISGGMSTPLGRVGSPMSFADIDAVIDAFASAARTAMDIGFDGIELHGGHGYLIDQFLWHRTNRRTDGYGGGHADRGRFVAEMVTEIRHRTAPDFPILLRYSQWKLQDYEARLAETPAELAALLAPIAEAGIDLFDCSQRRFQEPAFAGSDRNLAGWTRHLTGKPTMTVGSVGLSTEFIASMAGGQAEAAGLEVLLAMFADGQFDLVGVGRALIADANWVEKVKLGRAATANSFTREALATLY